MKFTRQELDKLTILDLEKELYQRLGTENASVARMNLELTKFKQEYIEQLQEQERLEAEKKAAKEEFLKKQKELSEAKKKEEDLLKNKELVFKVRWNNLHSKRSSLDKVVSGISNPDAWFRDFCNNSEDKEIEEILSKVEYFDYDLKLKEESEQKQYKLLELRFNRNKYLYDTDWTQSVTDSNLNQDDKKQYRLYRKYLRELPKLIDNKQVLDFKCMSFEEWFGNRPIFENSDKI